MRCLLVLFVIAACTPREPRRVDPDPPPDREVETLPTVVADPDIRFPLDAGSLAPSHTQVINAVEEIANVEKCEPCHADVVAQWRQSAHAQASFNNPWYRAGVDAFRDARGNEASRFCAGCHDIALLVDGAMDAEIRADDPRAHAGVTCLVCHSTARRTADGNGSYTLDLTEVLLPDPNVPEQVEAHRRRVAPDGLRTSLQCGTCHRSFVGTEMGNPHHVPGIDDLGAWRRSVHGGSHADQIDAEGIEERTCQQCHMTPEHAESDFAAGADHQVSSHRVAAAQTAMHAQSGDASLQRAQEMLQSAATVDIAAARAGRRWAYPAESVTFRRARALELDVVVRNIGAGHKFPGGTRDIQDTWIEVTITDAEGSVVASAGTAHDRRDDPTAFRLRSVLLDEEGTPDEVHFVHRFRAAAFDRTIAPRDAMVARYRAELPANVALPLKVEARLRHRRHGRELRELACRATRSPRGRAFARAARALGRTPLDGCAEQPITELARRVVTLGGDGESVGDQPVFERHYAHALGLLHGVQERLDEARPVLAAALEAAQTDRDRAAVFVLLGRVSGRQGRLEEALRHLERADGLVPNHPAVHWARGHAYAQVWQWENAASAYEVASELASNDVLVWRDLARARGSSGDERGALEAAWEGLRFGPRHPDLLRSQSLALTALEDERADTARAIFLQHRRVDEQPRLLRRCQREIPGCDRDRQPVPLIEMREGR